MQINDFFTNFYKENHCSSILMEVKFEEASKNIESKELIKLMIKKLLNQVKLIKNT